jgi:hypothetical protein
MTFRHRLIAEEPRAFGLERAPNAAVKTIQTRVEMACIRKLASANVLTCVRGWHGAYMLPSQLFRRMVS